MAEAEAADLAGCGLVPVLWPAAAAAAAVTVTANLAGYGCIALGWVDPVVGWDLDSGSGQGVVSPD